MQENQRLLNRAINNGLLTLGEPIMETIDWHLRSHGLFLNSNEAVDIGRLYEHLEQIVGHIADMIMDVIYEELQQANQQYSQSNPDEPVVQRIQHLLEMRAGGMTPE